MDVEGDRGKSSRGRAVTQRDVAAHAGVSTATASRSLDPDRASLVTDKTRERVERSAKALGYRTDLVASALRRDRTNTVGLVVADLSNPFYTPLVHGASDVLDRNGYVAIIAETREDRCRFENVIDSLLSRRVDAAIIFSARRDDVPLLDELSKRVPTVLATRRVLKAPWPFVGANERLGGELAAQHLLSCGYTIVAEIAGPGDVRAFVDRSQGFRMVIRRAREVKRLVDLPRAAAPSLEEGRSLMRNLVSLPNFRTPIGIFAHNDLMAVGALQVAHKLGMDCPEQIGVVGYNDSEVCQLFQPTITTVAVPVTEIGRRAAQSALDLMEPVAGGDSEADVLFRPWIVARSSTCNPAALTAIASG